MTVRVVILDAVDDVAVCIDGAAAGDTIALDDGRTVTARAAIPTGHKLAISAVPLGGTVHKYGTSIGVATSAIDVGDHVHVHNLASDRA
jgi:altronate dehydratase